jgi:DinB superfamily
MIGLGRIFEKLDRAQGALLRATEPISADIWKVSPQQDTWSTAELIAHIMIIERTVIGAADRILKKQPKHIPLLKRFHLPLAVVEMRLYRVKTPCRPPTLM